MSFCWEVCDLILIFTSFGWWKLLAWFQNKKAGDLEVVKWLKKHFFWSHFSNSQEASDLCIVFYFYSLNWGSLKKLASFFCIFEHWGTWYLQFNWILFSDPRLHNSTVKDSYGYESNNNELFVWYLDNQFLFVSLSNLAIKKLYIHILYDLLIFWQVSVSTLARVVNRCKWWQAWFHTLRCTNWRDVRG